PYRYALTAGSLPAGLSLNAATGVLSGTPTEAGSFPFTITASDSSSGAGAPFIIARGYILNVAAPTISLAPASLPDGTVGADYATTIIASGGQSPFTYKVIWGTLPSGMMLNANGTLDGTPKRVGIDYFIVEARDANGSSGTRDYSLVIYPPTLSLNPDSLPAATVGAQYSATLTASGGTAPYTYALSGILPAGLSLDPATGVLSGTPTQAGNFPLTFTASDRSLGGPYSVSASYTLTVAPPPTISLAPASLPAGTVGTGYAATISASGGVAPYAYSVIAGALPPGMTLSGSGTLSGTPTAAGTFSFTLKAQDALNFSNTHPYSLVIGAPTLTLSPDSLPAATAAAPYSATLNAGGGTAPYTYALSGSLPAGLNLNPATGVLSGTPTAAGSFPITIKATDSGTSTGAPFSVTANYTLVVATPVISLAPASLPAGAAGVGYAATISASGGEAPYAYSVIAGALPPGMTLSRSGTLSGTPTAAGTFELMVKAQDALNFSGTHPYSLVVAAPTISLAPATIAGAKVKVAYSQQFAASGGAAPYTYTLAAGGLPPGLALNSASGLVSGTPAVAGNFAFTLRATDLQGFSGEQALALAVAEAQPVAVDDSASTPANQAVTINVTANDSGPITSTAIVTPPAHGSAKVEGLNVVYTPAANYFGSDSLTYAATGPGGTSAPATVTITVIALPVPVALPQSATVLAGQSVTLD
ncbi:MAG: putative Ig domain-containing protein, partial [Burkholderiaceae bacterium]